MTSIDDILAGVLRNEGGYVNDPHDTGGETNFGITIATARKNGYVGAMRDMPRSFALAVYRQQYVIAPGFDQIAVVSAPIGAELIDTGVNMGPRVASTFLQRALNGLNNGGADYPDVLVDGVASAKTCSALRAFLAKRGQLGETRLLRLLNALQGERYLSLAEGRAANEKFLFGWLDRIAS